MSNHSIILFYYIDLVIISYYIFSHTFKEEK